MQDVLHALQLCEQLKTDSVEQLCMRVVGEMLLRLLCAQGLRNPDMLDSIKLFRNGKWEKLWKAAIKASKKVKQKKGDKPVQPRADRQTEGQLCTEMRQRGQLLEGERGRLPGDAACLRCFVVF